MHSTIRHQLRSVICLAFVGALLGIVRSAEAYEQVEIKRLQAELKETQARLEKEREALRATNLKLLQEFDEYREEVRNQLKLRDVEIEKLRQINEALRQKLKEVEGDPLTQVDGQIKAVDHKNGLVWIDLGSADQLPIGLTFQVFDRQTDGANIPKAKRQPKASIEVTRLLKGGRLAEARILNETLNNLIAVGDSIESFVWSPGKKIRVTLVGLIDLNGDGQSDRQRLHQILKTAGVEIDNEVDDQGKVSGKGVTVSTSFVVVGSIPDPVLAKPTEVKSIRRMIAAHTLIRRDARQLGVHVITLEDFMKLIGIPEPPEIPLRRENPQK